MAGDAAVVDATYSATLAITVNARREQIWPWLVQMGHQRGGLYSYDWLDRLFGYLDRPSADSVLPQFQQLAVGTTRSPLAAVGDFQSRSSSRIGRSSWAARAMASHGHGNSACTPLDETRTRLVSRNRVRVPRTYDGHHLSTAELRLLEAAAQDDGVHAIVLTATPQI